jgi:preprotein translocase subunit YajC
MNIMNIFAFIAFAAPSGGADPTGQLVSTLMMFGAMAVVMYLFIIRPQKKRQDEHQAMLNALKQGDKVVLSSGIHGSVSSIDDKTVLIQIADNVRIRVEKSAVTAVQPKQ